MTVGSSNAGDSTGEITPCGRQVLLALQVWQGGGGVETEDQQPDRDRHRPDPYAADPDW
jgi:hypothetical protein